MVENTDDNNEGSASKGAGDNSSNSDDGLIALSALLLDNPPAAQGKVPDDGELWDWIHGETSPARSNEIDQHIARDSAVYERWRQLRLHIDELKIEQTRTLPAIEKVSLPERFLSSIRKHLPTTRGALGTAALAGVTLTLAITVIPLFMSRPANFWQDWTHTKQQTGRPLSQQTQDSLRTVLSGIKSTMNTNGIAAVDPDGEPLGEFAPDCIQTSTCDEKTSALYALGELTASARLQCLSDSFVFNDRLTPGELALERIDTVESATILRKPLQTWARANTKTAHCAAISQVIDRLLRAL